MDSKQNHASDMGSGGLVTFVSEEGGLVILVLSRSITPCFCEEERYLTFKFSRPYHVFGLIKEFFVWSKK